MKIFDKFLKKLNISRNTFATYVLTLISVYLAVDRIVEMLLMVFTGVAVSYWGPIEYTLALACPIFAFLFSSASEFASSKNKKVTLFYLYVIGLYIIAVSMFTQWLNYAAWLLLIMSPNYVGIITEFSDLVGPALTSISMFIPLVTFFPLFKWLYFTVNDSNDLKRSIWDYGGINLTEKKEGTGAYSYEIFVCKNDETGKTVNFPEKSRFRSLFVCGGSGSGKTATVFEPFIARDINKKYFFREVSKELGFTALKTKIAVLNAPYNNDYLNTHFSLNMLSPAPRKENVYKSFIKKLILSSDNGEIVYKDLGLTVMSPDYEMIGHLTNVCENFGFTYNIIDPNNPNSIGLNPFVYDNPSKIAITISSALKAMYNSAHADRVEMYREDIAMQAIENLTILLKEIYPRMHEGELPNMEDLLQLLTNFDLVEKMCKILEYTPALAEKYAPQLAYFKKNYYKNSSGREVIEKYMVTATSQLDTLLRIPGVKSILCNRHTNINFDDMLANGEITFVCTRRGDLGASAHKAFGLFFILSMENSVLSRPGTSDNRIPNFLYIDEFPDFICKATEPLFTMYRKYKVATTVSAQNLAQLEDPNSRESFKNTILSNCASKIFTGNAVMEDLEWWSKELGTRREWKFGNTIDFNKMEYDSKHSGVKWDFVPYAKAGKLQSSLGGNMNAFKILNVNGKSDAGLGKFSYLESKYKEKQPLKIYNFDKYAPTDNTTDSDNDPAGLARPRKFNPSAIEFEGTANVDPIKMNSTDGSLFLDNEDAAIVDLKTSKRLHKQDKNNNS